MATNKITLAQIDEKIATFTTNRKALQGLAHEIAMLIMRHAAPKEVNDDCQGSGDCTRALKLTQQMPKSWAAQMENWFKTYSPIRVVTKNGKVGFDVAYKKLDKDAKITAWKLDEAAQNPFYELDEPEPATKELSFEQLVQLVQQLGKRIEKKAESNEIKATDIPSALAMAEKLSKIRFDRVTLEVPEANDDAPVDTASDMATLAQTLGATLKVA